MSGYYPDGVTQYDIDRAAGGYEPREEGDEDPTPDYEDMPLREDGGMLPEDFVPFEFGEIA